MGSPQARTCRVFSRSTISKISGSEASRLVLTWDIHCARATPVGELASCLRKYSWRGGVGRTGAVLSRRRRLAVMAAVAVTPPLRAAAARLIAAAICG